MIKYIGIIYGGFQSQAEINLDHAKAIGNSLKDNYEITYYNLNNPASRQRLINDRKKSKLDIVFNNSCGKKGGDGTVEGFLDILNIPYVGSGMLATAICFDKKTTKDVAYSIGLPIVKDMIIGKNNWHDNQVSVVNRVKRKIGFPLIVKASGGTDSIAVSKVRNTKELTPAIKKAFREDDHIVVERYIDRLAEVSCMLFGNGKNVQAFIPVQWGHQGDILLTDEKFDAGKMIIPPKLSSRLIKKIQQISITVHRVIGCRDYSRVDLIVDKNKKVYFLEINGHAGLGVNSSTVHMAKATKKWDHKRLINEILRLAAKRNKLFNSTGR